MYPVDKPKACSYLAFLSDRDRSYLPATVLYVAEHGVLDPN